MESQKLLAPLVAERYRQLIPSENISQFDRLIERLIGQKLLEEGHY